MARVLLVYRTRLSTDDGLVYTPQACGRERDDGTWEAWLEFLPQDGSEILRSGRETTQPNAIDLEYWATGLTPVYLRGALERVLTPPPLVVEPAPSAISAYDGPAPATVSTTDEIPIDAPVTEPVLNPFSVYAKGEGLLRRQLAALSKRHLRTILLAYELVEHNADLDILTERELIALIVVGVRTRLAA